jgi:penicillin-binding protein 1A
MSYPILNVLKMVLALLLSADAVPAAAAAWEVPPLDRVINYRPVQSLQILTADGVEIAQFGSERRQFLPIAQMPKLLQDAVIAVEDARFREHAGIDPKGMARALLSMVSGGRRQGASTITQQVARTFFLSNRQTAERKLKEVLIALKIEQQLSKDRILELYLNEIYLGQHAYGFAAASQVYFGKPLDKLSIAEVALLAGLPQNPLYANPISNLKRATQRQHVVLARMRATGVIDERQLAAAKAEPLRIRSPLQGSLHAEYVAEMARRAVVQRVGSEAYSSGIRVQTSLRSQDQQTAWSALRRALLEHDGKGVWRGPEGRETLPAGDGPEVERAAAQVLKDHQDDELLRVGVVLRATPGEVTVQLASGQRVAITGNGLKWVKAALSAKAKPALALRRGAVVRVMQQGKAWVFTQWPQAQGAFVALDPVSGRVRALVGGFDFARQQFNHVTQAWRQPGSSIKPFLYSAALEHGVMPASLIDDAPFTAANGWSPQNSDGRFDGPITLREALARSRNLVSVRLLQQVGIATERDWVERFGLDAARQPDNLTLALGAGSTTPLQLAQAYAVFANGGWRVNPVLVERITDAQGKVLFEAPAAAPLVEETRAVPARNVFVTTSLLRDVTRIGTAERAQRELKRGDVYGKTGTTNEAVDAWFAGFHPSLVAVAWMGYDEPHSLGVGESGGGLALPIWITYMSKALEGLPEQPLGPAPTGVEYIDGDWRYSEWSTGGWVTKVSSDAPVTRAPMAGSVPAASESR